MHQKMHIEFFDHEHFQAHYKKIYPSGSLRKFIDYFWETDFYELFRRYTEGFYDALYPNIGYTYLINLGTPFKVEIAEHHFHMKSDGFLPRASSMIGYHSIGNKIFGIKFKVSPVVLEKEIDFSEYKEFIFPLAYLIDKSVVDDVKAAVSFEDRAAIVSSYYEEIVGRYNQLVEPVEVVTAILLHWENNLSFSESVDELADKFHVNPRALRQYFESLTGMTTKRAYQVVRIRRAIENLIQNPAAFDFRDYSYYDSSHFINHMTDFLQDTRINPDVDLLKKLLPEKK